MSAGGQYGSVPGRAGRSRLLPCRRGLGCFLKCHGRVLDNLVGEEKVVHIDALPLYKQYTDVFLTDDVPEEERKAARQVADKIAAKLKQARAGGAQS